MVKRLRCVLLLHPWMSVLSLRPSIILSRLVLGALKSSYIWPIGGWTSPVGYIHAPTLQSSSGLVGSPDLKSFKCLGAGEEGAEIYIFFFIYEWFSRATLV